MNKVFEKIIEKQKELFQDLNVIEVLSHVDFDSTIQNSLDNFLKAITNEAIEIVKQEAEKYNNGWMSCSEKLPEVRQDVLVTVKYTGFMGMHGYWIKTGHMEAENDWWGDCAGGEVIAWQPLPEPFKERDCEVSRTNLFKNAPYIALKE